MSNDTMGAARPPEAWHNPTWVRALMLHPNDFDFLRYVYEAPPGAMFELPFKGMMELFNNESTAGFKAGLAAGTALACLYYVSEGHPVHFPSKPGLRTAFKLASAHAKLTNSDAKIDGNPYRIHGGTTRIATAFRELRAVSHLWAAVALHWHGLMGSRTNDGVLKRNEAHGALLGTARSVQNFALRWRDPRTSKPTELLGPAPWLVPDGFHLSPAWPLPRGRMQSWVLEALETKRRRRAKGSGR